ncbi:uncharacterized protein LOC112552964 [Pogonomyrmex barbatus]|uniref:Uncharacterized protein LOC112552964 n=1 Tax=Pogonomyrmex barbatus TaxID=144034 RepID=A0A8N1SB46_9HYME|nr:uncharacterized protein LOC112552964 [Pogonomyrmex barbatus]
MFLRIDDRLLRFGVLFLLWIGSSCQQEEDIPHNEPVHRRTSMMHEEPERSWLKGRKGGKEGITGEKGGGASDRTDGGA